MHSHLPAASHLPLLLTMGDPCGIGPELLLMQAARASAQAPGRPVVAVASLAVMQRAGRALSDVGHPAGQVRLQVIRGLDEPATGGEQFRAAASPGPHPTLLVWEPPVLAALHAGPQGLADLPWGQVHALAGQAAALCVRAAAQACLAGQAAALVTAPLHKEALALAGEPYPGHTELLQALATPPGQPLLPVRMMLANPELRTVLVTIHMALRQAIEALTFERVLETLRITHHSLRRLGLAQPRIGVAGLNPHAGEGGLFGREELDTIAPAVAAAQAEGILASGPHAPDTVFMRARHAPDHLCEFDVVVAMYHDQGLIPVKYLGVADGVNVTLGLPLVRTSPDHGTAFNLAGTGRADPASLVRALEMAEHLVGWG